MDKTREWWWHGELIWYSFDLSNEQVTAYLTAWRLRRAATAVLYRAELDDEYQIISTN